MAVSVHQRDPLIYVALILAVLALWPHLRRFTRRPIAFTYTFDGDAISPAGSRRSSP